MHILQLRKEYHLELGFERLYEECTQYPEAKVGEDYVIMLIEPARQFLESQGINTAQYNLMMLVNK